MTRTWQLQDAKNRFSELVDKALADGPQTVTRRGEPAVVVVSAAEFERLARPKKSWKAFLRRAPLRGVALDRSPDTGRDIDLP